VDSYEQEEGEPLLLGVNKALGEFRCDGDGQRLRCSRARNIPSAQVEESDVKLPIDTAGLTFLVLGAPTPVTEFGTGRAKGDRNGEPLYQVRLIAANADEEEGDIIAVKVPGEPRGLTPLTPVTVRELTAQPWSIGDKHGVAFRAAAITPQVAARNGSSAQAGS